MILELTHVRLFEPLADGQMDLAPLREQKRLVDHLVGDDVPEDIGQLRVGNLEQNERPVGQFSKLPAQGFDLDLRKA